MRLDFQELHFRNTFWHFAIGDQRWLIRLFGWGTWTGAGRRLTLCIGRLNLFDGQAWVSAGAPAGGPGPVGGQFRSFARGFLTQLLKFFCESLQLFREAVMNRGRQGAETQGVTSIRGRFTIGGLGGGGGHGGFGGDVGHFLSLSQRKELLTFLAVFSYQKVQKKPKRVCEAGSHCGKTYFLVQKNNFLLVIQLFVYIYEELQLFVYIFIFC